MVHCATSTPQIPYLLKPLAGESFLIPVGTVHVIGVLSDKPACRLMVTSPSAFARLIAGVAAQDETGIPDMELAERISAEIGDEILGAPGGFTPYMRCREQ